MRRLFPLLVFVATATGCIIVRQPPPAQPAPQPSGSAASDAAPPPTPTAPRRRFEVKLRPITVSPPSRGEKEGDDVVMVRSRVNKEVEPHHPALRACYDDGLSRNDKLAGIVQVKFTVAPNGEPVQVADEGSSLTDKDVIACILSKFARMRFTPWEGKAVTMLYPMDFSH